MGGALGHHNPKLFCIRPDQCKYEEGGVYRKEAEKIMIQEHHRLLPNERLVLIAGNLMADKTTPWDNATWFIPIREGELDDQGKFVEALNRWVHSTADSKHLNLQYRYAPAPGVVRRFNGIVYRWMSLAIREALEAQRRAGPDSLAPRYGRR